MISRRFKINLVLAMAALLVLAGCQTDPGGPNNPVPAEPQALTLDPVVGPPGTAMALLGWDTVPTAAEIAQMTAIVGGLEAPLVLTSNGQVLTSVPLLAAGETGQTPPPDPVVVEVRRNDTSVGIARGGFRVLPLAPAPGTSRMIQVSLDSICTQLARVTDMLSPTVGVEEQWTTSFAGGLADLVNGTDPNSLASVLARAETDNPGSLALIDSYLAATGILTAMEEVASGLSAVTLATAGGGSGAKSSLDQHEMASKMQFQSILASFGLIVIHDTAEKFAYIVGLAAASAGVAYNVPAAGEIGAILAVADFAVNKVVVGLYPSEITDFHIELGNPNINMGSTTTGRVLLSAKNNPPAVGIQDFVGLTLAMLGLRAEANYKNFRVTLELAVSFYLSAVQQFISSYADRNPDANLDISLAVVPQMTWDTVLTDPVLVDCLSATPETIVGLTDEVNWRASTSTVGEGRISARTAIGTNTLQLTLPPLVSYSGGAFGEQVAGTPTVSVNVTGSLGMSLDFPASLEPGLGAQLTVHAGYLHPETSEIIGVAGLDISIAVDGGTVADLQGVTDAGGLFTTIATANPDSTRLLLSVTAQDSVNNSVTRSLDVPVSSTGLHLVTSGLGSDVGGFVEVSARRNSFSDGLNDYGVLDFDLGAVLSDPSVGITGHAHATFHAVPTVSAAPGSLSFSGSTIGVLDAAYAVSGPMEPPMAILGAWAGWRVYHQFEVVGLPTTYHLSMNYQTDNGNPATARSSVTLGHRFTGDVIAELTGSGGALSGVLQPGMYTIGYESYTQGISISVDTTVGPLSQSAQETMSGGFQFLLTQ